MDDLFLGVDGGNSSTRALVIDAAGTVLGYGVGGNANHQGHGLDAALRHVSQAVQGALENAGRPVDGLAGAYFALAGDDTAHDQHLLEEGLAALWPGLRFTLGNDVWAGLRAGAMDGYGVAVNCGSGAGAVGRNADGAEAIIPDLGYIFGDSGGGSQIAIDAFRAVSRAADGRGQPTILTETLLRLTGCPSVEALRSALYHQNIAHDTFRAATRLVLEASAVGDAVATAILCRVGEELGVSAVAIARRLGLCAQPFSLVLTGGTFRTLRSALAEAATARVRREAPGCRSTLPQVLPVGGAVLLALDATGRAVTPAHYERLREQGYRWHPEETFISSS